MGGCTSLYWLLGFVYWSYAASRSLAEEKESEALEYIGGDVAVSPSQADAPDAHNDAETSTADSLAQSQERIPHAARNPLLPAAISGLFRSLLLRDIGMVVLGISVLVLGAEWLVDSATFIASYFGVSELVIGLSLVALGTSLPELAASVMAILYRRADIALGNLIGSNLFNMMAVVGITAGVRPLPAPFEHALRRLPCHVAGGNSAAPPASILATCYESLEGGRYAGALFRLYDWDLPDSCRKWGVLTRGRQTGRTAPILPQTYYSICRNSPSSTL